LDRIGFTHYFGSIIEGTKSEKMKLRSKPEGDIFCKAADELGVSYENSVVVEDATSGVEAGKRGGFGLVIGVARANNHLELELNGGDIIVSVKKIKLNKKKKNF
jgi:beta-phosphoglucomutase-like phosphatase (HAD superfamily)